MSSPAKTGSGSPGPTAANEHALRLLIVDGDEARTSRRLAEMLREDGFDVEVVRDGAHAIARFTRTPYPDALVTELTIGHVDLQALCRFGRAQRPGLPVLVLTTHPNALHEDELGEPAPLVFTKPVSYADLRDGIARALQAGSSVR